MGIAMLLVLFLVCVPVASITWSGQVWAPYADTSLNADYFINCTDMTNAGGARNYTFCFVNADETDGNNPAWGGRGNMIPLSNIKIADEVDTVRKNGGDVIISFGGAAAGTPDPATGEGNGYMLAQMWTDVTELQAQYQKVIDRFGATWIDFDVEQNALQNGDTDGSFDRRNQAIAGLKAANPGLKVAYCLPCTPDYGFAAKGVTIMKSAIANNADIDCWNLMAMDYGTYYTTKFGTNMSELGIMVVDHAKAQLMTQFGYTEEQAYAHMGYTPMIGQTDQPLEVFWLDTENKDALVIKNMVVDRKIMMMGAWSADRDRNITGTWPITPAVATHSGIGAPRYGFGKVFIQIESPPT